jgi:protein-S-isoprenylcysteine O-methyltransferase Ste14
MKYVLLVYRLGPLVTLRAVLLFLLSFREFRAAGTSVRGTERTTTIVRSGPYRFSRNPIYCLSFCSCSDCQSGQTIFGCSSRSFQLSPSSRWL